MSQLRRTDIAVAAGRVQKTGRMAIDVVPHPRLDHLVTGLDGGPLRRTEHRGVAWFGGRQAAQTHGMVVVRSQTAAIVSPFWVPDSLTYRSEAAAAIVVTFSASALYVSEHCTLAELTARLAPNEQQPAFSHVFLHLQGAARIPLGISYEVVVLAPPDAVVAPG